MELTINESIGDSLHETLSINEVRRIELGAFMDTYATEQGPDLKVSKFMQYIATRCDSLQEFAYCCFIMGGALAPERYVED